MELQQLNQRIAVVNGESKRLNNERQILIGRCQTLEKQLSDALAAYKQQYGIELTVDNIGAEVARVSALKEAEVSGIETMLGLIKAGRYDEAEKMVGGITEVEPEPQQEPQEIQDVPPFDVGVSPVQSAPAPASVQSVPETVAPPSAPPVAAPPAPPAAPPVPPTFQKPADVQTPPSAPSAPPASAPVSQDDTPPAPPPPFKPNKPLGTPKIGVPPAVGQATGSGPLSFQAILSGEAFNPQNAGGSK